MVTFSRWLACMLHQLECHNGWNGRIPQWLLSQDAHHLEYHNFVDRSRCCAWHNSYFLERIPQWFNGWNGWMVEWLNGWMDEMVEWLNGTMVESLNGAIIIFLKTQDAQHLEALV